jgi:hypothetical protein
MNKSGQMNMMIGLLFGFIIVTTLIALIPGFTEMLDIGTGEDGLMCHGGLYNNGSTIPSTATQKSAIGCLAFKLYIPYLVLAVLIGVVSKILYDRGSQQAPYQ